MVSKKILNLTVNVVLLPIAYTLLVRFVGPALGDFVADVLLKWQSPGQDASNWDQGIFAHTAERITRHATVFGVLVVSAVASVGLYYVQPPTDPGIKDHVRYCWPLYVASVFVVGTDLHSLLSGSTWVCWLCPPHAEAVILPALLANALMVLVSRKHVAG